MSPKRLAGIAFVVSAFATALIGLVGVHNRHADVVVPERGVRVFNPHSQRGKISPALQARQNPAEARASERGGGSGRPPLDSSGCRDVARGQKPRLQEEHRAWLFKHGGQELKGEVLRYGHMATLGLAPNGSLVAAWQASKLYEGASDQRVYVSFSMDGLEARAWAAPQPLPVALESDKGAQWSPILVGAPVMPSGRLLLFYTESSRTECLRPAEGKLPELWCPGGTIKAVELLPRKDAYYWSDPWVVLPEVSPDGREAIPKVVANPPTRAASGALVLPYWRESGKLPPSCKSLTARDYAGVLISEDEGATWRPHEPAAPPQDHSKEGITAPGTHLYEGTVAAVPSSSSISSNINSSSLLMLFRTSKGWAYGSRSHDNGRSWSSPEPTTAKNPDTKMHLLELLSNNGGGSTAPSWLLLATNDHKSFAEAGCRKCRTHLFVKHSGDGGASWTRIAALESPKRPPDYLKNHYPTMLQVGCKLFVAYSRSYSCCAPANAELGIRLVAFTIAPG